MDASTNVRCNLLAPLQIIGSEYKVTKENDPEFVEILEKYYDMALEDSITKSGGTNLIFGYAGCGLPLVLNHNCPNNSIYLLWGQTDGSSSKPGLKALFPRIARHEEGR